MTKEKKVHVIADETLGGVKREYVEVDRKAKAGDYVWLVHVKAAEKVEQFEIDEGIGDYKTLEPTDIVIIGDKRYRIEERLAEPDELILNKSNGLTYDVKDVAGDFIIVGDSQLMLEEDYVVLKRIDAPQSQDDIIANLIRRVAELERMDEKHREVIESMGLDISNIERNHSDLFGEVTGIKRDIETWAQEVESLKHDKEPKQITLDIDTLAKLIGGVCE